MSWVTNVNSDSIYAREPSLEKAVADSIESFLQRLKSRDVEILRFWLSGYRSRNIAESLGYTRWNVTCVPGGIAM
jgi:hypothetical protein